VHLIEGLRPDPEALRAIVAPGGPAGTGTVVLIDDVDLIGQGNPIEPVLREVATVGRDRGLGIAFAGSADWLTGPVGGWLAEAKRSRQGILLAPQTSMEGDLLGTRLAHSQMRVPVRPGRGYTTLGAAQGKVQVIAIPLTTLK
jgi:S-DNA-T family DNA segregation ATPase FtsK/SpoIIIE